MRQIAKLVLHCSASLFGTAALIDQWHRDQGWRKIGYHYLICNAYPDADSLRLHRPRFDLDGTLQRGRSELEVGAHVKGHNHNSLGICLIGEHQFTYQQFETLTNLLGDLRTRYPDAILVGHYELSGDREIQKTCPNLDLVWLRELIAEF